MTNSENKTRLCDTQDACSQANIWGAHCKQNRMKLQTGGNGHKRRPSDCSSDDWYLQSIMFFARLFDTSLFTFFGLVGEYVLKF